MALEELLALRRKNKPAPGFLPGRAVMLSGESGS